MFRNFLHKSINHSSAVAKVSHKIRQLQIIKITRMEFGTVILVISEFDKNNEILII